MPRVLIAGCGYVGRAAAQLFRGAGWEVEGWTASVESVRALEGQLDRAVAVDLSCRDQVAKAAGDFSSVIHCASSRGGGSEAYREIYWQGVENILEVFPNVPLLFTSSTSVYGQSAEEWVTETSQATPTRETALILREAEELTLSRGGLVARLAGIYGPGRSVILEKFLTGQAMIDPKCDRFINQAHRDDIAAALFLLVTECLDPESQVSSGDRKIYNVVDDRPIRQSECYEWLAHRLGRSLPATGIPGSPRKRGDSNKRVSNAKLRLCGWKPLYPTFQEGMENSILPSVFGPTR